MRKRALATISAVVTAALLAGCDQGGQGLGGEQQERETGGTTGSATTTDGAPDTTGAGATQTSEQVGTTSENGAETGSETNSQDAGDLTNKNQNAIGY